MARYLWTEQIKAGADIYEPSGTANTIRSRFDDGYIPRGGDS